MSWPTQPQRSPSLSSQPTSTRMKGGTCSLAPRKRSTRHSTYSSHHWRTGSASNGYRALSPPLIAHSLCMSSAKHPQRRGVMFNTLATAAVLALAVVLPGGNVFATSTDPDPLCEDSGLWGPKLFTDICWACLFPIKVAGAQLTPGKAPEDAATQHLCLCSKGSSGIY